MSLIYITGPTGAGKSTVRHHLAEMGYETYDIDDEGMRETIPGQSRNEKPMLTVPVAKIKELRQKASDKVIFLCGTTPTDHEYIDDFDVVILLVIAAAEQEQRIKMRTNSTYGKQPGQLETALSWRERQIEKYLKLGANSIDASQPIEEIVRQILKYTARVA